MGFFKKIWTTIKGLFTNNDNSKRVSTTQSGSKTVTKVTGGTYINDSDNSTTNYTQTIAELHIHNQNEDNTQKKIQLTIEQWGKISTKNAAWSKREYLNMLEQFAVGVKKGTYDFDTLCEMSRGNIIDKYNRYKPYIEERRRLKRPSLYIEFENLVERIKEKT